jgi:hypothetical protein
MDMAQAVMSGSVSLRQAVHYHLTANHYPPLGEHTEALVKVIQQVNDESLSMDDYINLGTDIAMIPSRAWATPEGWMVSVSDFLQATHAWFFVNESQD